MPIAEPPKPEPNNSADPDNPVVEHPPGGAAVDVSRQQLELRIRQQELLSELGVIALQRLSFTELLDNACRLSAEGLNAELCKILEFIPEENRFLMRAGIGWAPGLVGVASVGADLASPSGFALRTGKPVISNHLDYEERFRTPELLRQHGVRRAINVILQGEGKPYGILEVDSRKPGEFSTHDIAFLQGAANILGMAIERQRYERSLREALEHQKVLVNEINHRVKNSLQLVGSLFGLQASTTQDQTVAQSLQAAMVRVTAIARVHERLYRSSDVAIVNLGDYIGDICRDLGEVIAHCEIRYAAPDAILMPTDRAIRVALLLTELVTNAAKHAYPDGRSGVIDVTLSQGADQVAVLSVEDEGLGLPPSFDPKGGAGLGIRLVQALVAQTKSTLTTETKSPGTRFVVEIPIRADDS